MHFFRTILVSQKIRAWKIFETAKETRAAWGDALIAEQDAVAEISTEVDNQLQSLVTLLEAREQLIKIH